jgi:hypothetical protein
MTQHTITQNSITQATCDPATSVTKSLLAYGVLAGPVYVLTSVAQGLTRDGFEFTRHPWSLLANGSLGWIQVVNFIASGLMVVAMAVGLRRALRTGRGATWAPRLIAGYGLSVVAAGVFKADPALGFPAGTPVDGAPVTWHGIVHFGAAGVGFSCLIAACFVLARRFTADGHRGLAAASRITGVVFLAGFAAVASGGRAAGLTVAFVIAVATVWAWLAAVSLHLYRRAAA